MSEYKLVPVEPTEKEYLNHAEQEQLLLFASESDYLAIANGVWELFVIRAKSMLSASPTTDTITIDRAEYEAMKADAERYRWLRDLSFARPYAVTNAKMDDVYHGIELDQAIDQARKICTHL